MFDPQATIRRRLVYHGRVQGVGFRQTTASLARRFHVTGYVRNVVDGTVELIAEGDTTAIEAFLASVQQAFADGISQVDRDELPPGEPLHGFVIRH